MRGTDRCRVHGADGYWKWQAWKRYLLWVLLPDTVRTNGIASPVLEEEVELVCAVLAEAVLADTVHASAAVKVSALAHLLDATTVLWHEDPASLLTHLSREDAQEAIRVLRIRGLIR